MTVSSVGQMFSMHQVKTAVTGVQDTMCTLHCITAAVVFIVHYCIIEWCNVVYIVYTVQCAVHGVQCTVYSIQGT